jgi:ubiquinone/menaquinone biosynthesis C-methylase UbiE
VGCGPGLLPAVLAKLGCNSIGVDVDPKMFRPVPLHRVIATGDVFGLPFRAKTFDLVTASNLLFLLSRPTDALVEMGRVLKIGGKLALLNPSENLYQSAAEAFSKAHGLEGLAQSSLITWARRAEENHRWTEDETRRLYSEAGITFMEDIIKVGPGFARFSWGTT